VRTLSYAALVRPHCSKASGCLVNKEYRSSSNATLSVAGTRATLRLDDEAEAALIGIIRSELARSAPTDVVALDGCGSLFGVARVPALIGKLADEIPGRLLVTFPGKHVGGVYRLLDARDGWNYHATPFPCRPTIRPEGLRGC
jgi:hypothetical protein